MEQLNDLKMEQILKNSPTYKELKSLDINGLIDRYITDTPVKYLETFTESVNEKDEEQLAINYLMVTLEGKNLNWIYNAFTKTVSALKRYNHYLNVKQLVSDMESLLSGFEPYIEQDINNSSTGKIQDVKPYVLFATSKMQRLLNAVKNKLCFVITDDEQINKSLI